MSASPIKWNWGNYGTFVGPGGGSGEYAYDAYSDEGLWHETIPQDVSFNLDDMAYILYKTTKTWTGHFADGTDISKLTLSSSIGILPQYYHISSTKRFCCTPKGVR